MNKIQDAVIKNEGNIEGHIENKNNPHGVTPMQIGACTASYATASVSDSNFTAYFAKIDKLVICALVPNVNRTNIIYETTIKIPSEYRPLKSSQFQVYSNTNQSSGGNGIAYVKAFSNGDLTIGQAYGIRIEEAAGTYCWLTA